MLLWKMIRMIGENAGCCYVGVGYLLVNVSYGRCFRGDEMPSGCIVGNQIWRVYERYKYNRNGDSGRIGDHAFSRHTGLTTIQISQNVGCIEVFVFDGCTGFLEVWIENNVTSVGKMPTARMSWISMVTLMNQIERTIYHNVRMSQWRKLHYLSENLVIKNIKKNINGVPIVQVRWVKKKLLHLKSFFK